MCARRLPFGIEILMTSTTHQHHDHHDVNVDYLLRTSFPSAVVFVFLPTDSHGTLVLVARIIVALCSVSLTGEGFFGVACFRTNWNFDFNVPAATVDQRYCCKQLQGFLG